MRVDEARHLRLAAEQVAELRALQRALHRLVDRDPQRADRAVAVAHAGALIAGMVAAEVGRVEAVAQSREHRADIDLLGWPGELIASLATADALHQAAAPQQAHQLVHVGYAQAFPLGDLGGRHRAVLSSRHLEQATKPVFFLCRQPHRRPWRPSWAQGWRNETVLLSQVYLAMTMHGMSVATP